MSIIGDLADLFAGYPGFLPGVAVAFLLSMVAADPLGRSLGVRNGAAASLIVGTAIILAATLTPSPEALLGKAGTGPCDLTRFTPALPQLLSITDASLNIYLFSPLGVAIALLPRSRRKAAIVAAAVALPFAIEVIQGSATALGRACQSGDIADNLTGLLIGFGLGSGIGRFAPSIFRRFPTS